MQSCLFPLTNFNQVSHFPLWSAGCNQRSPVLCFGWPVDIKLFPGSYSQHAGCRKTKQGANWLFNFALWQHTFSCQCGVRTLGGDSPIAHFLFIFYTRHMGTSEIVCVCARVRASMCVFGQEDHKQLQSNYGTRKITFL